MSKMTFKEFQATRTAKTWDQARCQEMGTDEVSMEVLEYDDGNCFIECLAGGMYHLCVCNQDWLMPDLVQLEWLLYDEWYLHT